MKETIVLILVGGLMTGVASPNRAPVVSASQSGTESKTEGTRAASDTEPIACPTEEVGTRPFAVTTVHNDRAIEVRPFEEPARAGDEPMVVLMRPGGQPTSDPEPRPGKVGPATAIIDHTSTERTTEGGTRCQWQTIFTDGFEGAWYWTTYGYPTWRDTSYRDCGGNWSAWCADDGLTPPGPYDPNMEAWMVYGPFDLSDADDPQVSFDAWLDCESGFDFLFWGASADDTNYDGYTDSGRYQVCNPYSFSLNDFLGDSSVWFAFVFASDSSIQYEGAYVDDVLIEKCVGEGQPDLVIPSCSASCNPSTSLLDVSVDVCNDGSGSAGAFELGVYASTNNIISTGDCLLGIGSSGGLAPGACQTFSGVIPSTGCGTGTYYIGAYADHTFLVPETDEGNNTCVDGQWDLPCACDPPPAPSDPSPPHEAAGVPLDTDLCWNTGGGGAKIIYGNDYRLDVYEVSDPAILAAADATVSLLAVSDLTNNGNGTYSLPGITFAQYIFAAYGFPLCLTERFYDQPVRGFCSGFLVAPDLVTTAGHCIDNAGECAATAFVFGFDMLDASTPVLTVPASDGQVPPAERVA